MSERVRVPAPLARVGAAEPPRRLLSTPLSRSADLRVPRVGGGSDARFRVRRAEPRSERVDFRTMDLSGLKKARVSGHAFLHLGVGTPGEGYETHGSFRSNRQGAELRRGHLPPTLIVALTPKRARGRRASRRPCAPGQPSPVAPSRWPVAAPATMPRLPRACEGQTCPGPTHLSRSRERIVFSAPSLIFTLSQRKSRDFPKEVVLLVPIW